MAAGTLLVTGIERVVTMDASRRVLANAAIAVVGHRVVDIGAEARLRARQPDAEILDAEGGWVIPGLVDAHQHLTGDRLVRASIPDDITSAAAIAHWALPIHAQHSPDDDELSATLALTEALGNGVTCVVEAGTVAHPDRVAAAARRVGARVTLGRWGWDLGDGPYRAPTHEVIAAAADLLDRYPPEGLVRAGVTLVGHDLMSDELAVAATALARRHGTLLTYHLSPTPADAAAYLARTGRRPLVHLDRLGVLGPELLVAHAVHLDDAEVECLLRQDVAVASCPWAYLRLGQGFTGVGRHAELVRRGGRVALGCDSENAGDQIDVLRTAALFAGLAKDAGGPEAFDAHAALELATIAGARAVGRAGELGSIEIGKCADLVVFDARRREWSPPGDDVARQLVWGTDGRAVRHVIVDGEIVVRDGRSTRVDERELADAARRAGQDLRRRAAIAVTSRWPVTPAP